MTDTSSSSELVYQVSGASSATVAVWLNGVLKGSALVDASGVIRWSLA
jgi:hypothetical protein